MTDINGRKPDESSADFYGRLHRSGWTDEISFRGPTLRIRDYMMLREIAAAGDIGRMKALDVGCADFNLLLKIKRKWPGAQLFGCDITDASFGDIPERENIQYRVFDISTGLWDNQRFDLIVSTDSLEHVEDDAAALANIRKMLAPGGRFIFHLPFSMKYWSAHDESVGHFRRYEPEELKNKLRAAGFTSISMKTYGFPFLLAYFHLFLKRVPPEFTQRKKTALERATTLFIYSFFLLDSLFIDHQCGRGLAVIGTAAAD